MDVIALIGRLVLALAVVLGAMWLLARVAQKRGRGGAKRGQVLMVLARQSVSRNSTIAVVRVLDRAMIVGVTDGQITMLGDADLDAVEAQLAPAPRHAAPEPIVIDDVEDLLGVARPQPQPQPQPLALSAGRSGRSRHSGAGTLPRRRGRSARTAFSTRNARAAHTAVTSPALGADGTPAARPSPLAGSALSLATWKQTIDAVRDRTVRRS